MGSAGLPLPSRADRGEGGAMHGGAFFFREVGAIGDAATGRANVRFGHLIGCERQGILVKREELGDLVSDFRLVEAQQDM